MLFNLSLDSVEQTTLLLIKGVLSVILETIILVAIIIVTAILLFLLFLIIDRFFGTKNAKFYQIKNKIQNEPVVENWNTCCFELQFKINNQTKSTYVSKSIYDNVKIGDAVLVHYIIGKFTKIISITKIF